MYIYIYIYIFIFMYIYMCAWTRSDGYQNPMPLTRASASRYMHMVLSRWSTQAPCPQWISMDGHQSCILGSRQIYVDLFLFCKWQLLGGHWISIDFVSSLCSSFVHFLVRVGSRRWGGSLALGWDFGAGVDLWRWSGTLALG